MVPLRDLLFASGQEDEGSSLMSTVTLVVIVVLCSVVVVVVGGVMFYMFCCICRIQREYNKAIKRMKKNAKAGPLRTPHQNIVRDSDNRPSTTTQEPTLPQSLSRNLSMHSAPPVQPPLALHRSSPSHTPRGQLYIYAMDHSPSRSGNFPTHLLSHSPSAPPGFLPGARLLRNGSTATSNSVVPVSEQGLRSVRDFEEMDLELPSSDPPRYSRLFISPQHHKSPQSKFQRSATTTTELSQLSSWPQFT